MSFLTDYIMKELYAFGPEHTEVGIGKSATIDGNTASLCYVCFRYEYFGCWVTIA